MAADIKFKLIGEAYSVLSDADKQRKYEAGHDIEEINGGGGGGGGGGYEDIFAQFARQQGGGGHGHSHGGGGFPGGFNFG